MIYFSEIKGKKVFTEDQLLVGHLDDIIFLAEERALITRIVIISQQHEKLIIPISYLRRINKEIIIQKEYKTTDLDENELFIVKNLLDKQIIDIKGNKIVRVNDIVIQDKPELYIAGVDIGVLGIFRWLKIEKLLYDALLPLQIRLNSKFLSWGNIQPLELARGEVRLTKLDQRLERMHPADLADYLEKTNIDSIHKALSMIDEKKAARVIGNLNLNYRSALLKKYKPEKAAKILAYVVPDDLVDILLTFSTKRRQAIIDLLPKNIKKSVIHLLSLSKTQVGSLMTTEYITVLPDDLVKEVMNKIRLETGDFSFLNAIYVINKENQLIGVFNLHELLLQSNEIPVYKFMVQNVVVAHLKTPLEIVSIRLLKYKLATIPVIDDERYILGVVTNIDVIDYLNKK